MTEPKSNEQHRTEILAAIGYAVTEWARLEAWGAHLFNRPAFNPPTGNRGHEVFYSVQNLQPRLKMLDAIMSAQDTLPDGFSARWKLIYDKIGEETYERNNIVHGNLHRLPLKSLRVRHAPYVPAIA